MTIFIASEVPSAAALLVLMKSRRDVFFIINEILSKWIFRNYNDNVQTNIAKWSGFQYQKQQNVAPPSAGQNSYFYPLLQDAAIKLSDTDVNWIADSKLILVESALSNHCIS